MKSGGAGDPVCHIPPCVRLVPGYLLAHVAPELSVTLLLSLGSLGIEISSSSYHVSLL